MVKPSLYLSIKQVLSPQWHRNSLFGGSHSTIRVSVSNWLKVSLIFLPFALEVKGEGKAMHA